MTNDKLLELIGRELSVINDELGAVRADMAATRTDIEWLKKGMVKLQRELWAMISLVVGTALLYWFLR